MVIDETYDPDQIIAIKIPREYKNKIKAQLFSFAGLTNSKISKI